MLPALASQLFLRAEVLGMMHVGYVWIVTNSVGDVLETLDPNVVHAMEGVIGFRPYVAHSDKINNFSIRFKTRFIQDNPGMEVVNPDVCQLWAYDAVWAIATAVEMSNMTNMSFVVPQSGTADLTRIGFSQTGPKLLHAILDTKFDGLAGKFGLVDNQLQLFASEIVNVVRKSTPTIGFWTRENGIIRENNFSPGSNNINNNLKSIIWPGDSREVPKGWAVPISGKVLRILVPVKHGISVFVNISGPIKANVSTLGVTGYCIDVFNAVLSKLPYFVPYEFYPFVNSSDTYDNLIYQVDLKNYDAVVGDTTIRFDRTAYVDFTIPYTDSGVSMVAPIKPDARSSMWVFLKPLTTTLWLTSLAFLFFTGFVVWLIEHRINPDFRGTPCQQFGLIFYFAFSTLVFAHKEKLESNLSRFAVIIWVFVVLILTSSYTASLTFMLTVQQLNPTVTDLNQLIKQGDYVGYPDGSFVKGLLTNLGIDENRLKNYSTPSEYADALSKGSANGGIAAMFDEIPYLKVFLSQYCDKYTMTGPIYKTDGFGFVFPRGSPLLPDMSRAVLRVREGSEMTEIERKWFGESTNQSTNFGSSSLSFQSFAGLFIIIGSVSGLMLFSYLIMLICKEKDELISMITPDQSFLNIVKLWFGHYDGIDLNSPTLSWRGRKQEGCVREVHLTGLTSSRSPGSVSNPTSEINFPSGQEGTFAPPETESSSPSNRSPSEEKSVP
ncbi:hypothetical protein LUZ60_000762 [Juncus effusus]|nr:hypothetical protein LUZ60_000762 [Juncus effusus]